MRRMSVMAMALAAVIAVGCNKSDNRAANGSAVGTAGRAENGVSAGDRDFVRDVAVMNMAELELSRNALQKSAGADVKQFAQMMVDDHTSAGDKLKAVAAQHQIEVPAQIDDKHRDKSEKLAAKQGLDYDKDYADAMVDGHQDFVDKLESRIDKDTLSKWKAGHDNARTATPGGNTNPDAKVEATSVTAEKSDNAITTAINQWAADTYPVAYAHLQAAKAMRDGVKKRATN
jgi:putative membrane protein